MAQHAAAQDRSQERLLHQLLPWRPAGALDAFRMQPEPLGSGAFSRVLQATDSQGHTWALKLIQLPDSPPPPGKACAAALACAEVQAQLQVSRCPSILPLHAAFRTCVHDSRSARPPMHLAVLQLPLMTCNLMTLLSQGKETIWGGEHTQRPQLPPAHIKRLFLQMVNAVRHCHEAGITHQDVKAENFLLAPDGSLLLCDFGLAQHHRPGAATAAAAALCPGCLPSAQTSCPAHSAGATAALPPPLARVGGTCWTMSAARLSGVDEGPAADWFSIGVLLYQLHTNGAWPFKASWQDWERADATTLRATIQHAVEAGHVEFDGTRIPPEARQLIRSLLRPSAEQRGGLSRILQSRWLEDADLQGVADAHPQLRQDMRSLLEMRHMLQAAAAAPPVAWAEAVGQHDHYHGTGGAEGEERTQMLSDGRSTDTASGGGSLRAGSGRSKGSWTAQLPHVHLPGLPGAAAAAAERPFTEPLLDHGSTTPAAPSRIDVVVHQRRMSRLRSVLYSLLCLGCFDDVRYAPRYERL